MALDWERCATAMMHSTQVRVLRSLDGRVRSPRQLADELELPLAHVSHHMHQLRKGGVIVIVRERRKRGGLQHFYALNEVRMHDVGRAA